MSLDQLCLAAVVVAAVAGAFQGARPHLLRLGSVVAGWLGARALGPEVAAALHGRVPAFAAGPVGSVVAFLGCALAARLVLGFAWRLVAGEGEKGGADRGLGAVLGAVQAAAVIWVLLSALASWGRPVRLGPLALDPGRSELAALARSHSAFSLVRGEPGEPGKKGRGGSGPGAPQLPGVPL